MAQTPEYKQSQGEYGKHTVRGRIGMPEKNDPNAIRSFLDSVIRYETSHRIERFSIWERARLYFQDDQWLETDLRDDPTRSPFWKPLEIDTDNWMPLPVRNETVAPLRNERSRLIGVGSRPYVRIEKDSPENSRGAKIGKDALLDRLDKLHWFEKQDQGCHWMALYGTWVIKSYLDIDYTQTINVPVTTGVKCPTCDFKLAKPRIAPEMALPIRGMPGAVKTTQVEVESEDPTEGEISMKEEHDVVGCPNCPPEMREELESVTVEDPESGEVVDTGEQRMVGKPHAIPLEPFMPSDDEIEEAVEDAYGRSMVTQEPTIDTGLRNVSPYDAFPENSGLDVEIGEMGEFSETHIETLDWIRAHYKNGEMVKAEDALTMMRWHPVVGGSQHFYGFGETADPVLFDHHARVREFHKKPWIENGKLNRGRTIVMAGNVLLLDTDFMIESRNTPGKLIPRVHYEYIPWELRDRETFGISAMEWMFSGQDSINTRYSQVQYARHVFATPKMIVPDGAELTFQGFASTGYSSDIWYYTPGPEGEKPEPFRGMQLGPEWHTEEVGDLESIQRRIGTMEAEIGDVPAGVTAASALMYLGEKSAEGRKPRVQRIREAKKRLYKHQLDLIAEFYRERRYYHVRDKNDRWAVKSFVGLDLVNQTNVQLEDESVYDQRMFRRESIKEGLMQGTIVADSATSKRKINKFLDIPLEINEDENLQVEGAEDEWIAYVEGEGEPVVHKRLDYHQIHFQTHSLALMSERAKDMMRRCDYTKIQLALWGWDEQYDQLLQMEASLKAQPPTPEPPQPVPSELTGEVDTAEYDMQVQQWKQRLDAQAKIDAMPKSPEERIMQLWMGMLAEVQIEMDPEQVELVMFLLRFEAHNEAHYQLAQGDAQAAQAGVELPAPPGGAESPTGMIPDSAEVLQAGPGQGPGATTAAGAGAPV